MVRKPQMDTSTLGKATRARWSPYQRLTCPSVLGNLHGRCYSTTPCFESSTLTSGTWCQPWSFLRGDSTEGAPSPFNCGLRDRMGDGSRRQTTAVRVETGRCLVRNELYTQPRRGNFDTKEAWLWQYMKRVNYLQRTPGTRLSVRALVHLVVIWENTDNTN